MFSRNRGKDSDLGRSKSKLDVWLNRKKGSPVDFLRARPNREGGRRGSGGGYPDKDATEARFASRKGEQGGGTRDGQQRTEVDETGKGGKAAKISRGSERWARSCVEKRRLDEEKKGR